MFYLSRLLYWGCLLLLWGIGGAIDRVWLHWDQALPDGAQAEQLNRILAVELGLGAGLPPLFYRLTAIVVQLLQAPFLQAPPLQGIGFGSGISLGMPTIEQACVVYLLLSAILIGSVYGLGARLWNRSVGLWAAILCFCLPQLWPLRLRFGLDYPIVVMVTLNVWLLSIWWTEGKSGFLELLLQRGPLQSSRLSSQNALGQQSPPKSELHLLKETIATLPIVSPNVDRKSGAKRRTIWGQGSQKWKFSLDWLPPLPPPMRAWLTVLGLGYGLGLALLTSPVTLAFLLPPIGIAILAQILQRKWGRLLELWVGLGVAGAIAYPFYRAHGLMLLMAWGDYLTDRSSVIAWASLRDYCLQIPHLVFYPIFGLGIVGLIIYRKRILDFHQLEKLSLNFPIRILRQQVDATWRSVCVWLLVFLLGSACLSLFGSNSPLPTVPVWIVLLTQGLFQFSKSIFPRSDLLIRGSILAITVIFSLSNLFPILPLRSANLRPKQAENWQQESVLRAIAQAQPNLQATVGVLPTTPEWNAQTLNYVSSLQNLPIEGVTLDEVSGAGLDWYLLKTGEAETGGKNSVQRNDFKLKQQWKLPDNSDLQLYHRKTPSVVATPIVGAQWSEEKPLKLEKISVPAQAPPGQPIPITYTWAGSLAELRSGLVLLTWKRQAEDAANRARSADGWLHDHAIGLGRLQLGSANVDSANVGSANVGGANTNDLFQITETLAMMPPATASGIYTLEANYINRLTGDRYPLIPPSDTIVIMPDSQAIPAPVLDPVTQLRLIGENLLQQKDFNSTRQKLQALQRIQPNQDYLSQLQLAASARLQDGTKDAALYVAIALTAVLQNQPKNAVKILQELTVRDRQNRHAQIYLALAALLDLDLPLAQESLQTAIQMQTRSPLIEPLQKIVQGLSSGNFVQAWQGYRSLTH